MRKPYCQRGFTLIEILVVVAIISILAMAGVMMTSDSRERARATAIVTQLREIEKAFAQYRIDNQLRGWPAMNQYNVFHWQNEMVNMVNSDASWNNFAGLGQYLSEPGDFTGAEYSYFGYAGSTYVCGTNDSWDAADPGGVIGVAIRIDHQDEKLFSYLDDIIDAGDGDRCGRMRVVGGSGSMYYSLAESLEGGSDF